MIHRFLGLALLLTWVGALAAQEPQRPKRPKRGPGDGSGLEKVASMMELPKDFVHFARVPEGGQCPKVAVGAEEVVVLYYKGDGQRGDLFLTRTADDGKTFSPPVRANPAAGSVAAWEGVPASTVALAPDGSVHIAYFSAGEAPELHYVVEAASQGMREPLVLGSYPGLCSTPAVAIDKSGQAYLFFAADGVGAEEGQVGKRVWLRRCPPGGAFSEPIEVDRSHQHVSPQSAMDAHVDEVMGTVYVLYRVGHENKPGDAILTRGMRLLASEDQGDSFTSTMVDNFRSKKDPQSRAVLGQEEDTTLAIWDCDGHVFWSLIRRALNRANLPVEPKDRESNERLWRARVGGAASASEILMAWLEWPFEDRTGAPTLAWQVWYRDGRIPIGKGKAEDSSQATSPAVFPRKGRGFTILY